MAYDTRPRYMTPEIRAGIFAGESGGDYDALYGFNNREGKQFAGTRVSQMTLGQLDDFDRTTYGPWSEGQLGYRATPTGAYQIVGDTRRAAATALGFGPDTVYDQKTQDQMGEWILQNQGTGAWTGYRGPNDPSKFPAVVASAAGAPGAAVPGAVPQMTEAEALEKYGLLKKARPELEEAGEGLMVYAGGLPIAMQAPGAQDVNALSNLIGNRQSRAAGVQQMSEMLRQYG